LSKAKCHILLSIYQGDGTISISCGAVEMGQGINTKLVQTVAKTLDVPMDIISVKPVDVMVSSNHSPTWASWSTDALCTAAQVACTAMKARLQEVAETMDNNPTWLELIQECYNRDIDLTVRHMTIGMKEVGLQYFIYSATVCEVELDVLTGEINVRRVDILEDTGTSINPGVDIGQLEGAFVQALGMWLTEQMRYEPETGRLLTYDTWEYKPPTSKDIPEDFRVAFHDSKRDTKSGFLGSKAVGEQSFMMGVSAIFALRRAIDSVKSDQGKNPIPFYTLDGPATPEKLQLTTGITAESFIL